jgi:hypothetical protein
MSALPIDDLPALQYFLWGRCIWPSGRPRAPSDVTRLFATSEEAQAAAGELAERGCYSEFTIYVIEAGRLTRVSSAVVSNRSGRVTLDWVPETRRRRG